MKLNPINIEDRVYWKQIRGIDILFSDFRDSNKSDVIDLIRLQLDQINAKPNDMVYGVSLVKNTAYSSFIMAESKRNPLITKSKNLITTVVGLNALQKVRLKVLSKLYPNTAKNFDTTDEALDYILRVKQKSNLL